MSVKLTIPEEEIMNPGHLACWGCGATLALRYTLKALGKKTVLVIPACCCTVIDGPFPYSSYGVPILHCAFEAAASVASGVKNALLMKGDTETQVVAWAGDGGTYDIGIQALSGAAERREDIFYICYDNEAYMNTGIQRSSATPKGAWTTTTPYRFPKEDPKKDLFKIMVAHKIPYAATVNVAYPEDFVRKIKKAKEKKGLKFILVYAPCPTGWKMRPDYTIKVARLAVECNIFPLIEVEDGKWRITIKGKGKPVEEYIKLQGRFKHWGEKEIKEFQEWVNRNYEELQKYVEMFGKGG